MLYKSTWSNLEVCKVAEKKLERVGFSWPITADAKRIERASNTPNQILFACAKRWKTRRVH